MISMTHQRYMTEQIKEIPVVRQIQEAMSLCYEAGREPVALLVNQGTLDKIEQELREIFMPALSDKSIKLLFGLPILVANVKDFFLVDNRSWAEQKF
jgi:hypothetical protein